MPVKARVMFRRWFHHRTRSEYRELLAEENTKLFSNKVNDWTTVPGLIVEDDEVFLSVEDDGSGTASLKEASDSRQDSSTRDESASDTRDVAQRLSKSESFETLETEEESDLTEHDLLNSKRQRSIRWADSAGKELVIHHEVQILPPLSIRVVILMLNPAEKIFEFVQCEFQTDERLTVNDLLIQLPFTASMDALKKQTYTALYRGDREMVNIISIQDYDIAEGEILVAVAAATNPKHSIAAAAALLLQRSLLRAVQKAKLSGRALQRLMSSEHLAAAIAGAVPEHRNQDEEDEDSSDNNRLVRRVLSKELGVTSPDSDERQSDSEASEEEQDGGSGDSEDFPFVPVPDLDDKDFQLFREAIIDPYSPVARGRMADLPMQLLSGEFNMFEPPFDADSSDRWDEISSDEDEDTADLGPEPVESLTSMDEDEENDQLESKQRRIMMIQEEYVGMTAFSDVSDTDDDDDDDDENDDVPEDVEDDDLSMTVSQDSADPLEAAASDSSGESDIEEDSIEFGLSDDDYSDDLGLLHDLADEMEPVPEIKGDQDEGEEDEDDSGCCEQPGGFVKPLGLPEREACELSHISEVDTLEENDDTTAVTSLSMQGSSDEDDGMCEVPEMEATTDEESNAGDAIVAATGSSRHVRTPSLEEKTRLVYEASTYLVAAILFVGSVCRIAAAKPKLQPLDEIEEAEV